MVAEDHAEALQERYRLFAENASDLVFHGGLDWTLKWVSPSVTQMLGYDQEALLGKNTVAMLVHPDDLDRIPQEADLGRPIAYEARHRCGDGTYKWLAVTARLMIDSVGEPIGMAGSARDITDSVAARQDLERASARLTTILNAMLDPLVVLEAVRDDTGSVVDFVHVEANQAAGEHTHRGLDRLIGTRLSEIVPGQGPAGLVAMYAHVVDTGEPLVVDAFPYADEMQGEAVRLFDIRGVKLGDAVCLTFRDVTDRERGAERLAASEARYRMLAEGSSDVVMEHRASIRWVSAAVTETLGWDSSDWIGRELLEFVHPDDRSEVRDWVSAFMSGVPRVEGVMRIRTSDGQYRWMSSRAKALREDGRGVAGAVVGLRDVHDEYLATERLRRSEALFRAALTSTPVGVAVIDRNGLMSITNAGLERILQRDQTWLQ